MCWFVSLLPTYLWYGEKCALWEKALTKPNQYHAKDCSVIAGPRDSPFSGNTSHWLKWLHVFQGKTRLVLSRGLKIEEAPNVIRVRARILEMKYIRDCISIRCDFYPRNAQGIIIFPERLFRKSQRTIPNSASEKKNGFLSVKKHSSIFRVPS